MSDKIKYLYDNKEIADILAEGFSKICKEKPKFPVNYLARHLKNHTAKNNDKSSLIDRLQSNQYANQKLAQLQIDFQQQLLKKLQNQSLNTKQKEQFLNKIGTCQRHEQVLDYFCEWIKQRLDVAGVYIGELEYQSKKINLNQEDAEQAHLQLEKQKVVKFKFASQAQKRVVVGKVLTQDSVVGKLLNEPQGEEPPAEEQGNENQYVKASQIRGQVYIPQVVGNQELKFFRFPKLGAYFANTLNIKSYLKEKLFDQNTLKVQNYRKVLAEFQKELQQKEAKFKEAYDEKANAGAEEIELQEAQREFQRQKNEMKKPVQEDFSFVERKLVVCVDTLGLDKQITQNQKQQLRQFISHIKQSWESQQKHQLQKDIELYLSFSKQNHEQGHQPEGQSFQQQLASLIQQEEKEIPSIQQVQKVKDNEKLLQLESNTVRIEKTIEYMAEEKYLKFWDHLLELNVVKYQQVIKQFLIFLGFRKEEFCSPGTNVLDWQKTKALMKSKTPIIFQRINTINPRGSKPQMVYPFAKCSRIAKNLQGLEPSAIANYNIYLALALRIVQLYTKTRVQDRQARLTTIQAQRQLRQQKLRQAEQKANEKKEKLEALKADLQQKGQLETFDQEAWNNHYDQENPPIQIPEQIPNDIDRDLQDVPEEQSRQQNVEKSQQ